MMIKILLWVLLSYGLMNIVVYGQIFSGLHDWFKKISESNSKIKYVAKFIYEMISCPMCFSTWGGFFLSLIIFSPMNSILGIPLYYSWFFDGIFSSGCVWIINSIVEFFEENRIK